MIQAKHATNMPNHIVIGDEYRKTSLWRLVDMIGSSYYQHADDA
ncbi:hypothetical protein ACFPZK_13420 [Psychrobacter urativorans]|nr:hypothetical protein [Psychrobacter urativorans]